MPTHASALAIGHRLQEYIIGRLLGHGGFGLTYLAQDTNLNSLVAIKEFLPQEFAVRNPDNSVVPKSEFDSDSYSWGLERFKEEARALARFKHPNIVRVSRLLEANGTAYMVMDFEPGLTLSQYLKRNGPTLEEGKLLGLFLPVLDGLEALHRLQLVHRDIKPSNIYVRAYGGPMLIDFGAVRQAIGAQSRSLTSLVTPGYAPIEQYSSDGRQGAWSDLYAVGATLYYCMFGHAPADAARRSAAISDGSDDPYAAAAQRGAEHYSREILECVDWALQFRVRDRPQSAHAVRERLRSSPVPPQVIEVPESIAEVPELQHGVMSVPTLPASRSHARPASRAAEESATVVSLPTARHDSLGPLIDGTRGHHEPTEVIRRHDPLLPKIKTTLGGWYQRWNMALDKASQEPNTLTGRIATQLVKEPRSVRIAASTAVVVLLVLSIVVFARRSGGEDSAYKAAMAANTVQAWQDYLKVCKGCPHQAAAQVELDQLQKAQGAVALETQFRDLLAQQQLQAPASPNASDVLKQLQASAPDDAFIPQAKTDLAAALKAQQTHPAAPAPAKVAAKPAAEIAKKTPPKKVAKTAGRPAKPAVAAAKPATQAPTPAANEVMPKFLSGPSPKYPSGLKDKVTGWVDLEFNVNVDGGTSSVEVVDSSPKGLFEDAAMHAVHGWLFSPYTLDGVRQRKRIRWRVEFKPCSVTAPQVLTEGTATALPPVKLGNGLSLASAGFSARGARDYNEDRLGYTGSDTGFWALADGLGGHRGGARAAEIGVEGGLASLSQDSALRLEDRLKQAVSAAHARIRAQQKVEAGHAGMRTTLVLLGIGTDDMVWAHCGDSRLYHFRDGRLLWRTRDHSVVQFLVSAGEIAENEMTKHPERSRLMSCLGGDNSLLISVKAAGTPPRQGDVLLMASDGMWEHFEGWQLEAAVARCNTPEALLSHLAGLVGDAMHPTQDNYTAVAVYVTQA